MQSKHDAIHPQKHDAAPDSADMPKQRTAPDPRVAANLRRLMNQRTMSQSELSRLSKVGQSTISRILNGEDSPSTRTLTKVAAVFGVSHDEFFRGAVEAISPDSGYLQPVALQQNGYPSPLVVKREVPVIGIARMSEEGVYSELASAGADMMVECSTHDPKAYAIINHGGAMYPAIRDGWLLVIEPSAKPTPGEYVLVALRDGTKMVKELMFARPDQIGLMACNSGQLQTVSADDVEYMHSIGPLIPPSRWRL